MATFVYAFLIIGLAELGDKTQLLTLVLASRYRARHVLLGVFLATAALQFIAVSVGSLGRTLLPPLAVGLVSAALFLVFGLWIWLSPGSEEEPRVARFGPVIAAFTSFFVAEFGDKTQLATVALVSRFGSPWHIWLGATTGMVLINLLAILAGKRLGKWLPQTTIKGIAAVFFMIFGLLILAITVSDYLR